MHMEHVAEAKLLGVLLTPTLSMQSHVKNTISTLNQWLYLLNQLHKQGLNVSGLVSVNVNVNVSGVSGENLFKFWTIITVRQVQFRICLFK